jgi:hypothetical protein
VLPPLAVPRRSYAATAPEWQQEHPSWLYQGLLDGEQAERPYWSEPAGRTYPVEVHPLGDLPLPDGRLVHCDPLADRGGRPLAQRVAPGSHPAYAGVVTVGEDHLRVGALLVVTGPGPVVAWEMATREGVEVDPAGFGVEEFVGFGVDAGTGALLSPDAQDALAQAMQEDDGMLEDPLDVAMDASGIDAACVPPAPGALAVAAARSGWGDGSYPTWFGRAEDGSVAVVMTDFLLLLDPCRADPETDFPRERGVQPPGGWDDEGDDRVGAYVEPPAREPEPVQPRERKRGWLARLFSR